MMETKISGKGIKCPHCKRGLTIKFEHNLGFLSKDIDKIQETIEIQE